GWISVLGSPTSTVRRARDWLRILCRCAWARLEPDTPSLHDALPISIGRERDRPRLIGSEDLTAPPPQPSEHLGRRMAVIIAREVDRKSTRLNSSHGSISYAVFCLKNKTEDRN